jgi:aminomethyltransferase
VKHTPLYAQHVRDAATVINLKGVARAMHYRGHIAEHEATREAVTLCDVSHMGEINFEGPHALQLVQKLITNDASKLAVNQALYSVMCDENGIVIDDLVCFRLAPDRFVWVVNVTKTDEDFRWVLGHSLGLDVQVTNVSTDTALLALQGPQSREVLQRITMADLSTLPYYWLAQTAVYTSQAEVPCMISRTGYSGQRGYEIMVGRDWAPWVWDELLLAGRPLGIEPCGVAARESLRTEAGYLLNGNDMDAQTNPFEVGLGWVVKLTKDFIGRDALERLKAKGVSRKLVGLEMQDHYTVRNGYAIYKDGKAIGKVTSGPLSPSLTSRSFGLGFVEATHSATGTDIEVDIRGARHKARIVTAPFGQRKAKEEAAFDTFSPYVLRFAETHEWARASGHSADTMIVGFSDFGQRSLGDVLCVDLPKVGDRVTKGRASGWIDTYRRGYDIIAPVTGEVVEINEALAAQPSLINAYPYECSGLMKVRVTSLREFDDLMPFAQYAELISRRQQYDEWTKDRRFT